jgi:hypothetical protein
MITTRDLGLREKEVQKNLNETYSTLKEQPVGGLGAMIQKPNQTRPREKVTPTLFTPAPMSSSLPYLADDVKFRSNENLLQILAHLQKQKEGAKASIIYDDMKQSKLNVENDRIIDIVNRNLETSTEDMLRKYLSSAIDKSKNEERKILEERMKRMDLEMNPIRPAENIRGLAAPVLPTLTRGDMGRPNAVTQEDLKEVRTTRYAQPSNTVAAEINGLRKDLLEFPSFPSTVYEMDKLMPSGRTKQEVSRLRREQTSMAAEDISSRALQKARLRREREQSSMEAEDKLSMGAENARLKEELMRYSNKKLLTAIKSVQQGKRQDIGKIPSYKEAYVEELIKAKRSGVLSKIPYDLLGAPKPALPTIGGGGGGALVALREGANELLQKGII